MDTPILIESNDRCEHLIIESSRKQIRNILRSYVGLYDPFCELIQNAMDAVEKRNALDCDNYPCKIAIAINLEENTICVADNVIGFSESEFKTFLSPNILYKEIGKNRSNKGVGATYLAFGFYRLEVYTKSDTYENYVSFDNGRAWVYSDNNNTPMPEVCEIETIADLSWRGLANAESWYYALLTNTPLEHLDLNNESPTNIIFDIKLTDTRGV